jgi:hypothetical protein
MWPYSKEVAATALDLLPAQTILAQSFDGTLTRIDTST